MAANKNRRSIADNTGLQAGFDLDNGQFPAEKTVDSMSHLIRGKFEKVNQFFSRDIWLIKTRQFGLSKRIGYTLLKIFYIVVKGIVRNKISLQASSLTFITLMSVVPLFALMFSVAKGLNAQKILRNAINNYLSSMPEQIQLFIQRIFDLVDKTDFTALGIIGFFILFWAVIKGIGSIESTFNLIWNVNIHRSFMRKLSDYILVMLMSPMFIILGSLMIATMSSLEIALFSKQQFGQFAIIREFITGFGGMIGVAMAFMFLYGFLPNTKVKIFPAWVGGVAAGILWYHTQWAYVNFQIGINSYNAIYGVFATLPIFLLWLYLNWIIVLLGAEISFAVQNYQTYSPADI